MNPIRVLVCGSRNWTDEVAIRRAFDDLPPGSTIIHGGARGADSIAERLAIEMDFNMRAFHAQWDTLGKAAGPERNQRMIDEGKPDLVIAFPLPDSRGTWDMVSRAKRAGVEVRVVRAGGAT